MFESTLTRVHETRLLARLQGRNARSGRPHAPWLALLVFLGGALFMPSSAAAQDADFDGVPDIADNCVLAFNPNQHDDDQDLYGDVCDSDLNNDGTTDALDVAEFKSLLGTGDLEPDLNGDGRVDYLDLGELNARMGQAPGPRGLAPADVSPPSLVLSTAVQPVATQLPPQSHGEPIRRLARLQTDSLNDNTYVDFVEDELVLISSNPQDAVDVAARWNGVVEQTTDPSALLGVAGPVLYRIRVDSSTAPKKGLNAALALLAPQLNGVTEASSAAAIDLISIVASERLDHGLDVSINPILGKHEIAYRETTESAGLMAGVTVPGGGAYSSNAFEWKSMEVDPDFPGDSAYPVDTRAAEAWRVLEGAGRLQRFSRVMIADAGFWPNADFPPFTAIGPMRAPNTDPTGCGSGAPAGFDTPCESHGTHVVEAGFGLPDNDFGAAGPGGPVSNLTLLVAPQVDAQSIVRFVIESIPAALEERPDVINMSSGTDIPNGWCLIACPVLNFVTQVVSDAGILVVASAGNDSRDVDVLAQLCLADVCVLTEAAAMVPCELDRVLCIGATDYDSSRVASYSNWGTSGDANSVDLWAPGNLWSVNARNADVATTSPDDSLQIVTGTSFAAPFVSGVAALVHAADTDLVGSQIASCMMETAHGPGFDSRATHRVNAADAVRCALDGRSRPFLRLANPTVGSTYQDGVDVIPLFAYADDIEDDAAGLPLDIQWTSHLEGPLGSTAPGVGGSISVGTLRIGTHILTATVTDSHNMTARETTVVSVENPPPSFSILSPADGHVTDRSSVLTLAGQSSDPNGSTMNGPVPDHLVFWTLDGAQFATGHSASLSTSSLALGSHQICFSGSDADGASGTPDCHSVVVQSFDLPDVDILSPSSGAVFDQNVGPVDVELVWNASVGGGGSAIPFNDTRFYTQTYRRDLGGMEFDVGPWVDRTADVERTRDCLIPSPIFGCLQWGPWEHVLPISGIPQVATTHVRIRIDATDDSNPSMPLTGSDQAEIEIRQLF